MNDNVPHPDMVLYNARAAEAEQLAASHPSPQLQAAWRSIAEGYRKLASNSRERTFVAPPVTDKKPSGDR